MPNYANSFIYKICCNDTTVRDEYIGSTTNFIKRKSGHKSICFNEKSRDYTNRLYKFIRSNGGWSNWSMIEIERYSGIDKRDLEKRERYWIEKLRATLNKILPTRTDSEYFKDNKEKCYKYRKDNKDKVDNWNANYRDRKGFTDKVKCPCGRTLSKGSLYTHKKRACHREWEERPEPLLIFID